MKLRHLLNYFHKESGGKDADFVACMQETYIEKIDFFEKVFDTILRKSEDCNAIIIAGNFNVKMSSEEVKNRNRPLWRVVRRGHCPVRIHTCKFKYTFGVQNSIYRGEGIRVWSSPAELGFLCPNVF